MEMAVGTVVVVVMVGGWGKVGEGGDWVMAMDATCTESQHPRTGSSTCKSTLIRRPSRVGTSFLYPSNRNHISLDPDLDTHPVMQRSWYRCCCRCRHYLGGVVSMVMLLLHLLPPLLLLYLYLPVLLLKL